MMMKKIPFLCCCWLALLVHPAQSDPLDLSGFDVLENEVGSVVESGGVVTFTESFLDVALYFCNDFYDVDPFATTLSFDYEFILGEFDDRDYLQFNVNFGEEWYLDTTDFICMVPYTGHVEFDLTPYQGQTISLDWALVWDWDGDAGTTATISNIDVATTAPIPEPATMLLFGTGLAGLAGMRRRKTSK